MKKLLPLIVLLLSAAACARAQTAVYAAYSASDLHVPNTGWQYGPMFGLYYDHWGVPFVKAGLDARVSLLGSGNPEFYSGGIGPRIQLHPHILPLMPYAEALIGAGRLTAGHGPDYTSRTSFQTQLVGGLDMTIFPRLDWRVVDYSWSALTNANSGVHPSTLSTGLVLRLP